MAKISNCLTNRDCIHGTHQFGPKATKRYKFIKERLENSTF